jgi:hypothetical protein
MELMFQQFGSQNLRYRCPPTFGNEGVKRLWKTQKNARGMLADAN